MFHTDGMSSGVPGGCDMRQHELRGFRFDLLRHVGVVGWLRMCTQDVPRASAYHRASFQVIGILRGGYDDDAEGVRALQFFF